MEEEPVEPQADVRSFSTVPRLALDPLGQVVSHLYGEVLTVQRLHLMQRIALKLLGLNPHRHGAT